MKKISIDKVNIKESKILSQNKNSIVFLNENNTVIKIFNHKFLFDTLIRGFDIEEKIIKTEKINIIPEILRPKNIIYMNNDFFVGYTMSKADGISYDIYNRKKTLKEKCDLYQYAKELKTIEEIIRKAENIVFPDLLSRDNIFINEQKIQLIDFDGMQIEKYLSPVISESIGNNKLYDNTKYKDGLYYTKNLDIKSLIYLYFQTVFGLDLVVIDELIKENNNINIEPIIDRMFNIWGITNDEIKEKVCRLYRNDIENEYLDSTMFKIAEKYNISICGHNGETYTKKLIRKA